MTLRAAAICVTAATVLAVAPAMPALAAAPVSSLVVNATAVGSGYNIVAYPGSTGLKAPTLDYCGKALPSDRARSSRFQVDFQRGGPTLTSSTFISEEAVAYQKNKGASVRTDLKKIATLCPHGVTKSQSNGGKVSYRSVKAHLAGAPSGAIVLETTTAVTSAGGVRSTQNEYDILMSRGDNFVGFYFSTDKPSTTAGVKAAKAAAALLAKA